MARKTITRTSEPLYPEHPLEEHNLRVDRARQIMKDDNIDVLILSRNVNVFYMTGSRFVFVGFDAGVALAPQSTAIITQDADIYSQRFGPFDTDDVALHTTTSAQIESYDDELEIANILLDYGVKPGARIGIEWGSGLTTDMNALKYLELEKRLKEGLKAEIVNATPSIWKLVGIKSDLEVERMKIAVNAAARAMERVYDVIELGMSEVDVSRMVCQFMLDEGADRLSHAQVMAEGTSGVNLLSSDAVDRPIEAGWVHLDIGAKYKRYMSDINRGIFLGREPTQDEAKLYEVRKGINDVMDRTIKPGVSIEHLIDEVTEYVEGGDCKLKTIAGLPFLGHYIGMEPYQHPNLIPSSAQPEFQNADGEVLFQKGMMFTYEMAVDLPGAGPMPFFNIEDNVVVTDSGVENMCADLTRELTVKA